MAQLIATNQLTLTNLKEKAIDRTEISFWHGLSATKHPLGIYDCGGRDHYFGNEFNVTSGKTYTVRVIAKQTKGSIRLAGGIWYTAMTSGDAWDEYAPFTLVGEASEDGLGVYERKFVVASGKTKAKIYIQIEQSAENGYPTTWRIYDGQVFNENGQPLVTDQNNYGALTSPMATPNGTYIWKRTITYYTDGTSNTIWEYSGVGAKGEKGDRGNDGLPGAPGVGIRSTVSTYGLSSNETTQPATWTSEVPTLVKGQYLWTKNVWTYTDGRTETGYTKTYIPRDGNNGNDGIAGKDGVGIKSTSITYASSPSGTSTPTSGWSTSVPTVSPGMFLWTRTVWTYTDNTTETGYSVARMGTDGAQGTPGPKGADGKTSYHHWAYSDNADGTGLTLTDNGQRYMGYYTDYTQDDSTDKTKYRWADRWAKIEVGGENLIDRTGEPFVMGWGITNTTWNPETKRTRLTFGTGVERAKYDEILPQGSIFESQNVIIKQNQTYTQAIRVATDATFLGEGTLSFSWFGPEVVSGTHGRRYYPASIRKIGVNEYLIWSTVTWDRPDIILRPFDIYHLHTALDFRNTGTFLEFYEPKLELGTVPTAHSISENDRQRQLDSKADQEKVVYKTDISVTDEGIVHSASKTVNGQTIASMIAQHAEWVEIIAKLLKVKGDMIVDGTIGANKLSVSTLSALAADLGKISGGSLELLKSEAQGNSLDSWGSFAIPAHKSGLYIDNIGAISSGTPVRKSSSESTASDMPVAVLTSGQLRFARVNQNNDLGSVLHYGLSDPDNATISFAVASDGTKQLLIQANGQIVNQGTNYTGWNSTGVSGVYYKRQGDVVALKMQVTTTANQALNLGRIPVELLPIPNSGTMMRVTAWTADQSFGQNLQINSDGSMVLLPSNRGDAFNTQVTWII